MRRQPFQTNEDFLDASRDEMRIAAAGARSGLVSAPDEQAKAYWANRLEQVQQRLEYLQSPDMIAKAKAADDEEEKRAAERVAKRKTTESWSTWLWIIAFVVTVATVPYGFYVSGSVAGAVIGIAAYLVGRSK